MNSLTINSVFMKETCTSMFTILTAIIKTTVYRCMRLEREAAVGTRACRTSQRMTLIPRMINQAAAASVLLARSLTEAESDDFDCLADWMSLLLSMTPMVTADTVTVSTVQTCEYQTALSIH